MLLLVSIDGGREDVGRGRSARGFVHAPRKGDGGSVDGVLLETIYFYPPLLDGGRVSEEVPRHV